MKSDMPIILKYALIKTTNRLTFDIIYQDSRTIWYGEDDGDYIKFKASNGYEVFSRSRMDIQTERIWLLGAKHKTDPRSGSMVFSSNEKRDIAYDNFVQSLDEWASYYDATAINLAHSVPQFSESDRMKPTPPSLRVFKETSFGIVRVS